MTVEEIIRSLEEQAQDKTSFVDKDDPDDVFTRDIEALREAVKLLRKTEPPNDPLTLDELKDMHGEPVWIDQPDGYKWNNGWALVNVSWKAQKQVYAVYTNGASDFVGILLAEGGKIYRRKPEEAMRQ